jgi:hypothetical protein
MFRPWGGLTCFADAGITIIPIRIIAMKSASSTFRLIFDILLGYIMVSMIAYTHKFARYRYPKRANYDKDARSDIDNNPIVI